MIYNAYTLRLMSIDGMCFMIQDALRELEEEWLALDPVLTTCVAHETFPLQATTFATTTIFWTHTITK